MVGKKDIDLNLRSKSDIINKSIAVSPSVCWYLTLGALIVAVLAMPVVRNFLNVSFALNLKKGWSKTLYPIDFSLLVAVLLVSGIGLFLNSIRHRRRTDRYNTSLVYFLVLSAICIIGYLIFFKSII